MSGRSCTSGSVRSGAGSVRLGAGSARLGAGSGTGASAAHEGVLDALYDRKRDKKSVRVLTVIIYVFCVSLAAIMLSLYYVFFWEPKDAQYAQRKVSHNVDQQTSTTPMPTCFMPHTGGGNTTVSEPDPPPETSSLPASDPPEPPDPTPFDSYTASTPPDINDTWVIPNVTLHNATDQR